MTFQRLIDSILNGLPFVYVYLDDILIASPTLGSHRRHVADVLRILQQNSLVINSGKCVFGVLWRLGLSRRLFRPFSYAVVPDQGTQLYAGKPESSGAYLESRDMCCILFCHACVSLNQTLYQ
jgi:hypothetical protein